MTTYDDVPQFLENWQATLQEVAIAGCTFENAQQFNLLLRALPSTWSAFITTQGVLDDLSFDKLFSNILQQNVINQ